MIRVTARTRRRASTATCSECGGRIDVGDGYRELVAVQEDDTFNRSFARLVAHDWCVSSDPCWTVTTRTELHRRAVESLAFVRQRYGLDVRPGQRCVALGEPGAVVEGDGKYLRVLLDGQRHALPYHPRDVALCATQPEPAP